jgi:hypothetical protein
MAQVVRRGREAAPRADLPRWPRPVGDHPIGPRVDCLHEPRRPLGHIGIGDGDPRTRIQVGRPSRRGDGRTPLARNRRGVDLPGQESGTSPTSVIVGRSSSRALAPVTSSNGTACSTLRRQAFPQEFGDQALDAVATDVSMAGKGSQDRVREPALLTQG